MTSRRTFIKQLGLLSAGAAVSSLAPGWLTACTRKPFDFKISLAQWSLHKAMFSGELTTLDFPVIAREEFGLDAVEYVNQFFKDQVHNQAWLNQLKTITADHGVRSLLIMVDDEGHLSSEAAEHRQTAIDNHKKWVDAAHVLGCHSIRVNLHGNGDPEKWVESASEGMAGLVAYGESAGINIIVENHGQHSSNAGLLVRVMENVNNPYCGTLPDFGNFCLAREKGDLWESPCIDWYDRYLGVEQMLPYAKGVSAKAYGFDAAGNETSTDFKRMLQLLKSADYSGYVGIEYEGSDLNEYEGIQATIDLLNRVKGSWFDV